LDSYEGGKLYICVKRASRNNPCNRILQPRVVGRWVGLEVAIARLASRANSQRSAMTGIWGVVWVKRDTIERVEAANATKRSKGESESRTRSSGNRVRGNRSTGIAVISLVLVLPKCGTGALIVIHQPFFTSSSTSSRVASDFAFRLYPTSIFALDFDIAQSPHTARRNSSCGQILQADAYVLDQAT
jgi:hypothetical protein